MNPQPEEDLQRRLQNLEAEINSSSQEVSQSESPKPSIGFSFESFNSQLIRLQNWFNSLTGTRKLAVLGVMALLGIAVVQALLKLVASVISLAVLAVLVYVGYKFFVSSNFQQKK
ncbi:hypothetical protein H6G41_18345 [Tolypothrix sp. FACHB-123]|uniref:hypothetical protein n=1 Tax=Tolypothrix sp. FACHB-123 TaxID=2692868 RepID=UPI0016865C8D|nr:hypothetical protein [Tolypothrix sp. FACHB-123]MBD2356563.1 hypothetical protein [Tolypothrix sp. FACHB-123]